MKLKRGLFLLLLLVLVLSACGLDPQDSPRGKLGNQDPARAPHVEEVLPTPELSEVLPTPEVVPGSNDDMSAERRVTRVDCLIPDSNVRTCFDTQLTTVSSDETGNVFIIESLNGQLLVVAAHFSDGEVRFISDDETLLLSCPVPEILVENTPPCSFYTGDFQQELLGKESDIKMPHFRVQVLRVGPLVTLMVTEFVVVTPESNHCGQCTLG